MKPLRLLPGPRLLHAKHGDVCAQAHSHLFETVELDAGVTLADVFGLLSADAVLLQVYRRDFAVELVQEAAKGAIAPADDEPEADRIEHLRLYQTWERDSSDGSYQAMTHLQLDGVGPVLSADAPDSHHKAGERIAFSVSLTPVRKLLHLPLRVDADVPVIEADTAAKRFGQVVERARQPHVTLGQVLHGVLWDLSFHGAPAQVQQESDRLRDMVASLRAGTLETVPAERIFAEWDEPVLAEMFIRRGSVDALALMRALADMEDGDLAEQVLAKRFAGSVLLAAQYAGHTGYRLRQAFGQMRADRKMKLRTGVVRSS